jgi:hypothetical protein
MGPTPELVDGNYRVVFAQDNDDGVVTGLADGIYDYVVRYKSGSTVGWEGQGRFFAQAAGVSSTEATFTNTTAVSGGMSQQLTQPYQYVGAAKVDGSGTASESVAIAVSNATEFQNGAIGNVSYYRSGGSIYQTSGLSVNGGYVGAGDATPTQVRATVYRVSDNALVAQTYTDVGYASGESWQVPNSYDEYNNPIGWDTVSGTRWYGVNNWGGQANLTAGSLAPDHYRIVLETWDSAQAAQAPNAFYDHSDGTWAYANTLSDVVIGTITRPTVLSWSAATQPSGTASVSFQYRAAGSTGAYSSATVGASGQNQQVSLSGLANGSYEYVIQYKDSYGRVLKSSSGNFASTQGGSSSVSASFTRTTYSSSAAAAGSSLRYYTQASQWAPVDHVSATVTGAGANQQVLLDWIPAGA